MVSKAQFCLEVGVQRFKVREALGALQSFRAKTLAESGGRAAVQLPARLNDAIADMTTGWHLLSETYFAMGCPRQRGD